MESKGGKNLANPKAMRNMSDKLDETFGWKDGYKNESNTRAFIHGVWHAGAGVITGNKNEFTRAGE